jgi:hypothetical protein
MKKSTVICVVLIAMLLPVGVASADDTAQKALDSLLKQWLQVIMAEDVNGYADCYWPDASIVTYAATGKSSLLEGSRAIRQRQQEWADKLDFSKMVLQYPEPRRFLTTTGGDTYTYVYDMSASGYFEVFEFQRRSGVFKILRQVDLYQGPGFNP